MTCVVVVVETASKGKKMIMMGADRAVSWSDSVEVKKSPKVILVGPHRSALASIKKREYLRGV